MSAAKDIELELDERIDGWLKDGGRPRIAPTGAGETGPDTEVDELMQLVDLVADHGFVEATRTGAARAAFGKGGRASGVRSGLDGKGAWILRVAAVILLMAALGVGLSLGLGGRSHGSGRPTNTEPQIPSSLLSALENEAGFWGDPYPTQPIQWVRTTTTRIDHSIDRRLFGADWRVAIPKTVWLGELYGNFYGQPATRSGLFHWDVEIAFIARGEHAPSVGVGEIGAYYPLGEWGTVHYYRIPGPAWHPPTSPLPSGITAVLERDASLHGQPYPAAPALWVMTTLGRFERETGLSPGGGIARTSASATMGVAAISGPGVPLWVVWDALGHYSYLGEATPGIHQMDTVAGLSKLGSVRQSFVGPVLPKALPGYVDSFVTQDLESRYLGATEPWHVSGAWTVTTVGDLRQTVLPQVNDWLEKVPGGMPIFVIDLTVKPTKDGTGHSDWVLVTPEPNGTSGMRVGTYGDGGSTLWGITHLSQLGSVHQVRFDRSGLDYRIAQ